ncbi:MAG: hypothetical protein AAF203_03035 [Pseudomonadota bacterium]
MKMAIAFSLFLFPCLGSTRLAISNCLYNGKILDSSRIDPKYIKAVPDDFTGERVCLHSNGKTKEKVSFKKGKEEGLLTKYDSKGNRVETASMKNGKRHGLYRDYHHQTYVLVRELTYKNGELDGIAKEFDRDSGTLTRLRMIVKGRPVTELSYNKFGLLTGLQCGEVSAGAEDDKLCSRQGLGKMVELHFSNSQQVSQTFYYQNMKKEGEHHRYDRKGKLRSTSVYRDGKKIKYDRDDFKTVKKEGREIQQYFFKSGKKEREKVLEGRLMISDTYWYENSNKKREINVDDDTFHEKTYFDSGKIHCQFSYKKGGYRRYYQGEYLCKTKEGVTYSKEKYKNGKFHGEQVYYSEKGKMSKKRIYKEGVLKTSWNFNKEGKLKEKFDHEPDGSRIYKKE